jgi:hypothetical protein
MQHTAHPGADTTCRTGNGRQLFGREFALLHSDRMRPHGVVNLSNLAQCHTVGSKKMYIYRIPYPNLQTDYFWILITPTATDRRSRSGSFKRAFSAAAFVLNGFDNGVN